MLSRLRSVLCTFNSFVSVLNYSRSLSNVQSLNIRRNGDHVLNFYDAKIPYSLQLPSELDFLNCLLIFINIFSLLYKTTTLSFYLPENPFLLKSVFLLLFFLFSKLHFTRFYTLFWGWRRGF